MSKSWAISRSRPKMGWPFSSGRGPTKGLKGGAAELRPVIGIPRDHFGSSLAGGCRNPLLQLAQEVRWAAPVDGDARSVTARSPLEILGHIPDCTVDIAHALLAGVDLDADVRPVTQGGRARLGDDEAEQNAESPVIEAEAEKDERTVHA